MTCRVGEFIGKNEDISQDTEIFYAYDILVHPENLTKQDEIILHALGAFWTPETPKNVVLSIDGRKLRWSRAAAVSYSESIPASVSDFASGKGLLVPSDGRFANTP